MVSKFRSAIIAVLFVAVLTVTLYGQTYQGGVRGLVTDAQGAVVPNAQVTLLNEATKVTRESETNPAGQYVFPAVEPGTYTISISATGFDTIARSSITV